MCTLNTEHSIDKEFNINYVKQEFEMDIMPKLTSNWSKNCNSNKKILYIYQFGQCPGYAEREIELTASIQNKGWYSSNICRYLDV